MSAAVTVVVVNWNGAEFLPACLEAASSQQVAGGIEVVVIDNGSSDGSLELLARQFPSVPVVRNARNNYTAANNLGVARARGPWALLLNTDATLQPGCVQQLVTALERDPRAAAAAPLVLYPDGRVFTTGIEERADLYWVDRDQGAPVPEDAAEPARVFGVSGCCALFRVQAWREVGGQDEDFHMYYEDVDLALRLQAAGWHSLYVSRARCAHIGHGSIDKVATGKDPLGERNRLLVLARHHPDRLLRELVRSPWFQSADPAAVRDLLPLLAKKRGGNPDELLLDLMLALRDAVREHAGELDARWGEHRNLPRILAEREAWIGRLLQEVARLRIWRLPSHRLKPMEAAFLERLRAQKERGRE
jgi:GT2 family glycosyltransferase